MSVVGERHLRWAVGGSLLLLVATAALARTHRVSGAELAVDRWVYDLPTWSTGLWRAAMQCGSRLAIPVVVVLLLVQRRWRAALLAGPVVLLAWALGQAGKRVVGRGRPTAALLHRPMRDLAAGNGYPSTHTVVAVGLALSLLTAVPLPRPAKAAVVVLGAATAVARVHVTAHWPLDVVGGAALAVVVVGAAALLIPRQPAP